MAVTQIVGPRIAPYWADPVEWTSTRAYEPFTFVTYQGDSYCSRQDTPIGIDITNDDYWVKVSDYNAQAVALQREMTNTIEAAESSMESTIQTAENDMTSAINTAESNMAAQVSAVESVKNEFQTQLDQVTTNKNDITTINANMSKYALYVGNSWTFGLDDEYAKDAIFNRTKHVWTEAFSAGNSSAGITFGPRDYNFATLTNLWITQHPNDVDKITHIFYNVAVGDAQAFAISADTYRSEFLSGITDIIAACNKFPNLKYVGFVDCDALYMNYRSTGQDGIYVNITHMQAIHSILCQFLNTQTYAVLRSLNYNVAYYGWIGWNMMGMAGLMNNADNIHPTRRGYEFLSNAWLAAINGHVDYKTFQNTYNFDASNFASNLSLSLQGVYTPTTYTANAMFYVADGTTASIVTQDNWVTIDDSESRFLNINNCVVEVNGTPVNIQTNNADKTTVALRAHTFTGGAYYRNFYIPTVMNGIKTISFPN